MPTLAETVLQAQDPTVPADTLWALYEGCRAHHDHQTRKFYEELPDVMAALAKNPNTPLDILSRLMLNYAPAFCQNPVAPLVLLERPDFFASVVPSTQLRFLRCADAPASLVQALVFGGEASVANEARQHIAYAGELSSDAWPNALGEFCRAYCAETRSADEKQFHADYAEIGFLPAAWPEAQAPLPSLKNKTLSAALNGHVWEDAGGQALARVFAPHLDPKLLQKLAEEANSMVSIALLLYPHTPAAALHEIAGREAVSFDDRLRLLAARHANADADLLRLFAGDKNPVLRRLARHHKNAPADVQELCRQTGAKKRGDTPLWFLINGLHDKASLETIRTRSGSLHWVERLSAVFALSNGKSRASDTRREMLVGLSGDANRFVRAAAKTTLADPDLPFRMVTGKKKNKRMEPIKAIQETDALLAARDFATPAPVLETTYQNARRHYDQAQRKWINENPDVMTALAQNPNLPPHLLRLLLQGYPEAVCQNPVVPLLPLELPTFWSDAREDDVLNLLRFPTVPPSVVQTLAGGMKPAHLKSDGGSNVQKAARLHIGFAGELAPNQWQDAVRDVCRDEAHPANERIEQLFADWVEIGLMPAAWWRENNLPPPVPVYEPKMNIYRPSFLGAQDKLAALPPDATPEQLHALIEGRDLRDSSVTIAVALHPNTGPETLRHLGKRREHNLGLAVALHPNTPPDALRYFAEGTYQGDRVRKLAVARHPHADAQLLRVLAGSEDPVVRRLARKHKNAPDDLMLLSRQAALTVGKTPPHLKNAAQLWFIFHALRAEKPTLHWLTESTASHQWMKRLGAALALVRRASEKTASAKPGKAIKWSTNEQKLIQTLQNDGNRLVRAVANAPVAPVFDFAL